jgi:hypothetical protein
LIIQMQPIHSVWTAEACSLALARIARIAFSLIIGQPEATTTARTPQWHRSATVSRMLQPHRFIQCTPVRLRLN